MGRPEDGGEGGSSAPTGHRSRRASLTAQMRQLVQAIVHGDDQSVEAAVRQLSQSRRVLAPLAFAVGAVVMLFHGLRLLFIEWRLSWVQILPAMWIWAAMLDLKLHLLKGRQFRVYQGSLAVFLIAGVVIVSAAAFYLNGVFALAISRPGRPQIGPAFSAVRRHLSVVLGAGLVTGVALGFSVVVVPRWGLWWFTLSLGVVIAAMMVTYVTVPSRLVGMKTTASRRDNLTATVVGAALGALVCAPAYALGRVGILLLGTHLFFVLGVILLSVGLTFQAGATGAVKAIKMSAKLLPGPSETHQGDGEKPAPVESSGAVIVNRTPHPSVVQRGEPSP